MSVRWAISLPMWTFIASCVLALQVQAQELAPEGAITGPMKSPEMPGMAMGPSAYGDGAMYPPEGMGAMGYGDPGAMYGPDGGFGPEGYCPPDAGPYRGLLGDFLGLVGPYADGGCCAPRYFDVSVEAMWLQRDDSGGNVDIGSQGIGGPIVLSTDQFNFEETPSVRFNAWLQFRSKSNLEFTYYGLFHFNDTIQVDDPTDNLYSALSQFGTVPFGGFIEEGQAAYQRISYSSNFDNFEFNYRRHWQGPNCRFQGSYLFGMRYFKLEEDFQFVSVSTFNQGALQYDVDTDNSLTGGQVGGDLWMCIIPGLRMGAEGKVGLYGNHSSQGTQIAATSLAIPYTESVTADDAAFVGDLSLFLTYRITQQFNLKFGYNFLYVDGVSLATENFNPAPPQVFFAGSGRTPTLNDNGNLFYHGASIGVEYNW